MPRDSVAYNLIKNAAGWKSTLRMAKEVLALVARVITWMALKVSSEVFSH
jgi:hypothetical protein